MDDAHHEVYGRDYRGISGEVRAWAIENGENSDLRIALCGYDTEHAMADGWHEATWTARAGYGPQENSIRERIWFSPHCLRPEDSMTLFDGMEEAA